MASKYEHTASTCGNDALANPVPIGRRRFLRLAGCLAGAAALGGVPLAFTGCRDSEVLTEKIIDENLKYTVDYSLEPMALNNPNASSTSSQDLDQSDRQDESQPDSPKYDDQTQTSNDSVNQTTQGNYSQNTAKAQTGKSSGAKGSSVTLDGSTDQKKAGSHLKFDFTGSDDATSPDANAPTQDKTDDANTPIDGWNVDSNENTTGNKGTTAAVVGSSDIDGGNIPDTVAKVAANGINATLVQAIGGTGGSTGSNMANPLVAANAGWLGHLTSEQYENVFPGEKDSIVAIDGWGEGESTNWSDSVVSQILTALGAMSEDYVSGTACVVAGYGEMSQTAAQAFVDKGVNVIELKPMGVLNALDDDIVTNVNVIGQLLRGMEDGGSLAATRVQQWNYLHTTALETTLKNNGGYTCWIFKGRSSNRLYVGDSADRTKDTSWVSANRNYALFLNDWGYYTDSGGSPISSIAIYQGSQEFADRGMWFYAWPIGDWGDEEKEFTVDLSVGAGVLYRHRMVDGYDNNGNVYNLFSFYMQHSGAADFQFANPLLFYVDDGDSRYRDLYWSNDLSFYVQEESSTSKRVFVGDSDYPYLIVRDSSMAQKIQESSQIGDSNKKVVGFFNVGQDYGVAVMPCGVAGSWADGSFESFLMVPYFWCLYMHRNSDKNITCSYSDDYVNGYYKNMYRCNPGGLLNASNNDGSGGAGGYGSVFTVVSNRG
jgi:hypothetical protein